MSIGLPIAAVAPAEVTPSPGFWKEVWKRFSRSKLSLLALAFVGVLCLIAICSPLIVGTKPIVCYYKQHLYFPALSYFNPRWENRIFYQDKFRQRYPINLAKKDSESWAIWPLVFQDPYRPVMADEWPGQPANPTGADGRPNRYNLFGTTQEGVDVFAGMIHGTMVALSVGFISMGIAALIGITIGSLGGYFGGWVDNILSRLTEVVMCIPTLVLILALISILEEVKMWHLMAVIGATSWTGIARLARAEFLKLRTSEFVTAARSLGAVGTRIMFRHILPNSLAPLLVPISFGIASSILVENALSFLGFGASPPNPSWGTLLNAARTNLQMWWLVAFPGTAIFFTVLTYNLIGEGLQEATDPRLKGAKH